MFNKMKEGVPMTENNYLKNKIINVTKELISKGDGDINKITIRAIAEKADVGVGLINYHFKNKENLIEICVQQMIGDAVDSFRPDLDNTSVPVERLSATVKQVMDFLFSNEAISRISILSDMKNPTGNDNSTKTMLGFLSNLKGSMDEGEGKKLIFALTAILQSIFLRKDASCDILGIDVSNKKDRDELIELIIRKLFNKEG
jgi:AcrR family transcriptional regulator